MITQDLLHIHNKLSPSLQQALQASVRLAGSEESARIGVLLKEFARMPGGDSRVGSGGGQAHARSWDTIGVLPFSRNGPTEQDPVLDDGIDVAAVFSSGASGGDE